MVYKPLVPGRHGKRRKVGELMLVPMIDILCVLVTFLLMTAVFTRIAIIQLDLPSALAAEPSAPTFRLEVVVRLDGLELTNGRDVIASLPLVDGAFDLATLSSMALALKKEHPEVDDASVLMQAEVEYDHLIQVMDAIRTADARKAAEAGLFAASATGAARQLREGSPRVPLFTNIAVGDAS